MNKETIGQNAGLIWQVLQEGEKNVKVLRKEAKLKDKDMTFALGWLAREDKVNFKEVDGELFVSLA